MIRSDFKPLKGFPLYVEKPAIVNQMMAMEVKKYREKVKEKLSLKNK